jgi:hypothetical protein
MFAPPEVGFQSMVVIFAQMKVPQFSGYGHQHQSGACACDGFDFEPVTSDGSNPVIQRAS